MERTLHYYIWLVYCLSIPFIPYAPSTEKHYSMTYRSTDTCHSDHWKKSPIDLHRKSIEPFQPLSPDDYPDNPHYEWRTIRGYLSKRELALFLSAVINTGAGLECNSVRPKRD